MPFLLAILGAMGAVIFYMIRARNAADAANDLVGMAQDVAGAARRFGFRRKANIHPVDAIEDVNIGIATVANAFMESNDLPTQEMRTALQNSVRKHLNVSEEESVEMLVLAKWIQNECGGPDQAISRAGRKTARMDGARIAAPLMQIVQDVAASVPNGLSPKQVDTLNDIKRIFRL
ncbi:MAG: hypothetical protein ACPG5U_01585 [Planktomarina sp.]